MCVIIYKPRKKTLKPDTIAQAWARNGQGAGYVFIPESGDVVSEKGIMELPELQNKIKAYCKKAGELVVHFRIQSRGGVSKELTHPFTCDHGRKKRFLFHNGTVRILSPVGEHSDSSLLAQHLKVLDDNDAKALLTNLSEKGFGRFVLVSDRDVNIFEDKESANKDGLWFSNLKHETHKGPAPKVGDGAEGCYGGKYYGGGGHYGYDDYGDMWDGMGMDKDHYKDNYYKDEKPKPPPVPAEHETVIVSEDKELFMRGVATKVAICNNIPPNKKDEYVAQILIDHKLLELPDEDYKKLKEYEKNSNPLLDLYLKMTS